MLHSRRSSFLSFTCVYQPNVIPSLRRDYSIISPNINTHIPVIRSFHLLPSPVLTPATPLRTPRPELAPPPKFPPLLIRPRQSRLRLQHRRPKKQSTKEENPERMLRRREHLLDWAIGYRCYGTRVTAARSPHQQPRRRKLGRVSLGTLWSSEARISGVCR